MKRVNNVFFYALLERSTIFHLIHNWWQMFGTRWQWKQCKITCHFWNESVAVRFTDEHCVDGWLFTHSKDHGLYSFCHKRVLIEQKYGLIMFIISKHTWNFTKIFVVSRKWFLTFYAMAPLSKQIKELQIEHWIQYAQSELDYIMHCPNTSKEWKGCHHGEEMFEEWQKALQRKLQTHFHSSTHLANYCVKWVCLSDCQFQNITKSVNPPLWILPSGRGWGGGVGWRVSGSDRGYLDQRQPCIETTQGAVLVGICCFRYR